jgi:hypothetical protein
MSSKQLAPVPKWALDYLESLAQMFESQPRASDVAGDAVASEVRSILRVLGDTEKAPAEISARVDVLERKVQSLESVPPPRILANAWRYECRRCHGVLFAAEQDGSLMCPSCPGWAMFASSPAEQKKAAELAPPLAGERPVKAKIVEGGGVSCLLRSLHAFKGKKPNHNAELTG